MNSSKGEWGSNFGFLMAAVGSAVGLGNLWGFPYKMGMNGGFAFLLFYLILAVLVGYVIMLGELTIGRSTGKGVIAAYSSLSKKYAFLGWMAFLCPILILAFYCSLGGYCLKYTIANLGDFFGASWGVNGVDTAEYFVNFYTNGLEASIFAVIFSIITVIIVMRGVSGGIEKFSKVAMPALFVLLLVVIVRGVTLPGAIGGLKFMFAPNWEVFNGSGWVSVLATAGGQMFFSLSLGMGCIITYGAYLSKKENIEVNALIIPFADTVVAIMAGLAVFPAVFAMGMEPAGGPGLLFITLQAVFDAMGAAGPIFGFLLYLLVFIAALTSSISLMEVVVSVIIDRKEEKGCVANRKNISVIFGLILCVLTILISVDSLGEGGLPKLLGFCWLDFFDLLSEGIMMPVGALLMSLIIGWKLGENWMREELCQEGNQWKMAKFSMFCLKFIAPVGMAMILLGQLDGFFKLGIFS
ncbi:MAG: sodium-dependent transporter [Clostridiales bacterium]|uniref:sodium-dependent transporter n=1 Tax=Aminipila sp. TaxID=2060095 RepID=UPI001DD30CA3|nr:sodium-dependent transporter [Aminipila sp.]MBE6033988.1 sodium-dependent transporter [Clostridiales bacterium]